MIANVIDGTNDAGGSQEFRAILRVLVQEKAQQGGPEKQEADISTAHFRRKPRRTFRIWVERGLLTAGLTLLVIYGVARLESFVSSQAALNCFAGAVDTASTSVADDVTKSSNSSELDFGAWGEHRIHAYQTTLTKELGTPLAVLHISKIGLAVPLLDGTGALTLNHAVGRIPGTARPGEPGNIGIAGHRDGFFRGLKDIAIGDAIELETPLGTETYLVDKIDIVDPTDVGVLQPLSKSSLTLVTCYPFHYIGRAPQRYIVHASRTEFEPQEYNPTGRGSLTLANHNKEKTQ
jgi:sortase A